MLKSKIKCCTHRNQSQIFQTGRNAEEKNSALYYRFDKEKATQKAQSVEEGEIKRAIGISLERLDKRRFKHGIRYLRINEIFVDYRLGYFHPPRIVCDPEGEYGAAYLFKVREFG